MEDNKTLVAGVVALVAIIIAAVGAFVLVNSMNDDENDSNSDNNQESMMESKNIVELAQATGDLSTLTAAVTAADLGSALSDQNAKFTVFAPTNNAFAQIQTTVNSLLLPENITQLQSVLQYHVVSSEVMSGDLKDGQIVETLGGETLKVRIVDGMVYINDAKVVTADVKASNGVVHIIDKVLVPGAFGNIVTTASSNSNLSTLVTALQAGNLVTALEDKDVNFTVFAPLNSGFSNIQSTVDTLLQPANISDLQKVLQYHVVSTEVFSSELSNGQEISTIAGDTLRIEIVNGEVFVVANNSRAKVVSADIKTSNGVVHVIDEVLVP